MATFIVCSTPGTAYFGKNVVNNPVNIDMCKYINKYQECWYSDKRGKPAIAFVGCGVIWMYDFEETRDADYFKIIGD